MRVYTHTDLLQLDRGLQVRVRIDPHRVEQFESRYLAGEPLPPIIVFDTGADADVLADGYHRIEAFLRIRGRPGAPSSIPATQRQGSRLDAWLFALSANDNGSLTFSAEDRIAMMLRGYREHGLTYERVGATGVRLTADDEYAVAVALREEDDLSYDRVAAVLGRTEGKTVEGWIKRGYVGRRAKPARTSARSEDGAVQRLVDSLAGGSLEALTELQMLGADYVARRLVALEMGRNGEPWTWVERRRLRMAQQREYLAELAGAIDALMAAMDAETGRPRHSREAPD